MTEEWTIEKDRWHFCKRLFQRYGIVLEFGEYEKIAHSIKTGEAKEIEKRPLGATLYSVSINNKDVLVIERNGYLVTVYPIEFLNKEFKEAYKQSRKKPKLIIETFSDVEAQHDFMENFTRMMSRK